MIVDNEIDCSLHMNSFRDDIDFLADEANDVFNWKSQFLEDSCISGASGFCKDGGPQDESWTHESNFLADSPYFSASVEKEVNYSRIVSMNLKDIVHEVQFYSKVGRRMANITRNLSCHLNAGNMSEEASGIRRKALGPTLTNLFEGLGKAMEDIATAQERLCKTFEDNLDLRLIDSLDKDLKATNDLKSDASNLSGIAERDLSAYLNDGAQGKSTFLSMKDIDPWSTNKSISDGISSIHQIRVAQAKSELSRFDLMNFFVNSKYGRNIKICVRFANILKNMQDEFQTCSNTVSILLPLVEIAKNELAETYSDDNKRWEERSIAIHQNLDDMKLCAREVNFSEHLVVYNGTGGTNNNATQELAEQECQFWDTPNILAANSRYRRAIPEGVLLEGWLYEKNTSFMSRTPWNRKWYMLKNGALHVLQPSANSDTSFTTEKVCDIVLSTVRELDDIAPYSRFCFQLMVSNNTKPITLKARGPLEMKMWVDAIRDSIESELASGDPHSSELNQCIGKKFKRQSMEIHDTVLNMSIRNDRTGRTLRRQSSKLQSMSSLVQEVMEMNNYCAECAASGPDWISLNLGILVCINCSGVHRSLGVHVSKVRSLSLDSLTDREAHIFLKLGNRRMNGVWEKMYNSQSEPQKPEADSNRSAREKWITTKYVDKQFLGQIIPENDDNDSEGRANNDLYKAAILGDLLGVASAVAQGGDVNWKNDGDSGASALEVCLMSLQLKEEEELMQCVEFLVLNGADVDLLDDSLHDAYDQLFPDNFNIDPRLLGMN